MDESNFKWYVLKAISGKEQKVKEEIEKRCAHSDAGKYVRTVLIPTEKVVQLRGSKKVTKERVFLPGYVLVEANLVDECYPLLRNTPNVLGFLTEKNNGKDITPTPVPQREIDKILGKQVETEQSNEVDVPYTVGESVKVIEGPFKDWDGEIDEVLADKRKLKVIVTVFGRKTPLELGFNQVAKE